MATSQAQQISTTTADATPEKGAIEQLYTEAPASGLVVCLDEMGSQASKSYPGRRLVRPAYPTAE
jgi:hypothetical protein